jgi:flagellar basal body L-ring protein FlgH
MPIMHVTHDAAGNAKERTISKIQTRWGGHLYLEFQDGSTAMVTRTNHEKHALMVGDIVKVHSLENVEVIKRASQEGASGSPAGDAEVQSGDAALGQQEGAASDVAQASDSDKPEGSGAVKKEKAPSDGRSFPKW